MVSSLNIYLFNAINSLAGKSAFLDKIMLISASYLIYAIPIFILYLWFRKGRDNESRKVALFVFSCAMLSLVIGWIIGLFYFHPRPFMLNLGTLLMHHSADNSFPSDHGLVMFSVALALLYIKKYKSGIVMMLLAIIVGFARVFVGVHFPFDILGSLVISLFVATLLFIYKTPIYRTFESILRLSNKFI